MPSLRRVWAVFASALLASCGGSGTGSDGGDSAPLAALRAAKPLLAATPALKSETGAGSTTATPEMTLDWAEYRFPQLFPEAVAQSFPSVVYQGVTYNARAYYGAWGARYLGISLDGHIFGLGDFTSGLLRPFETVEFWSAQVLADRCTFDPAACKGKPAAGAVADRRVFVGMETTLDGSSSRAAEGGALRYRWSLVTRPAASRAQLSGDAAPASRLTADVEGTYVVTLVVSDQTQDSDALSISIEAVRVPDSGLHIVASRDLASRAALESIFYGPLYTAWNPTAAGGPGLKIMMFGAANAACPGGTVGPMGAFADRALTDVGFPGSPTSVPSSMRFQAVPAAPCGPGSAGLSGPSLVFSDTQSMWLSTSTLGAPSDLLRPFGTSGQDNNGSNVNILNTSVNFRLSAPVAPTRPWAVSSTARLAMSASIVELKTTGGTTLNQAKQQLSMQLGNSSCRVQFPGRLCALEWLHAIGISQSDVSDWSKANWAQRAGVFGDPNQGGMPILDITLIPAQGEQGRQRDSGLPIFVSRGAATQHAPFDRRTFAVDISFEHLKNAVRAVSAITSGEQVPSGDVCRACERLFGAAWNDPAAWVVDELRSGQEIYDTTGRSARVTGSWGWMYIGPAP